MMTLGIFVCLNIKALLSPSGIFHWSLYTIICVDVVFPSRQFIVCKHQKSIIWRENIASAVQAVVDDDGKDNISNQRYSFGRTTSYSSQGSIFSFGSILDEKKSRANVETKFFVLSVFLVFACLFSFSFFSIFITSQQQRNLKVLSRRTLPFENVDSFRH